MPTIRIGIIGAGQIAEALVGGWLTAGRIDATAIRMADPSAERQAVMRARFDVACREGNREPAMWADVVFLAVKPHIVDTVLREIASCLAGKLVVSLAAGVTLRRLTEPLPTETRVIRVMPNAAVMVRAGMSAFACAPGVSHDDVALVTGLLETGGRVAMVDECDMDVVTGLSGSGPAFVLLILEALADGGVNAGLSRQAAEVLAAETVSGAARTVLQSGRHPAWLKDQVTSPGGTTIAGLHALERGGFRGTLMAAVAAATARSQELGHLCSS